MLRNKLLQSLTSLYDKIIVFDFETSGLDFIKDEIIDMSFIIITDENIEEKNYLVNIEKLISQEITNLTHITNDMLTSMGYKRDYIASFMKEIFDSKSILLVGYNVGFDLNFLLKFAEKSDFVDRIRNYDYLDVMTIFKDIKYSYPHKLSDAITYFNVTESSNTHRASDDAKATLAVLEKMLYINDDISKYINYFGYNPKYEHSLVRIGGIVYAPQPYSEHPKIYHMTYEEPKLRALKTNFNNTSYNENYIIKDLTNKQLNELESLASQNYYNGRYDIALYIYESLPTLDAFYEKQKEDCLNKVANIMPRRDELEIDLKIHSILHNNEFIYPLTYLVGGEEEINKIGAEQKQSLIINDYIYFKRDYKEFESEEIKDIISRPAIQRQREEYFDNNRINLKTIMYFIDSLGFERAITEKINSFSESELIRFREEIIKVFKEQYLLQPANLKYTLGSSFINMLLENKNICDQLGTSFIRYVISNRIADINVLKLLKEKPELASSFFEKCYYEELMIKYYNMDSEFVLGNEKGKQRVYIYFFKEHSYKKAKELYREEYYRVTCSMFEDDFDVVCSYPGFFMLFPELKKEALSLIYSGKKNIGLFKEIPFDVDAFVNKNTDLKVKEYVKSHVDEDMKLLKNSASNWYWGDHIVRIVICSLFSIIQVISIILQLVLRNEGWYVGFVISLIALSLFFGIGVVRGIWMVKEENTKKHISRINSKIKPRYNIYLFSLKYAIDYQTLIDFEKENIHE